MKSLKERFKDNTSDVLDYTKKYGRSAAMDKFEVKDYICFVKFLEEATNEPNFGIAPTYRPQITYRPLDLQYMDECASIPPLIKYINRLQDKLAKKRQRRDELERQLFMLQEQGDYELQEIRI